MSAVLPTPGHGQPWAYLVQCQNGALYAGWTNDLPGRLYAHRSGKGGAKYTKAFGAARLAYAQAFATQREAMRREAALKKMSRAEKLALAAAWRQENRPRLRWAGPGDAPRVAALYNAYVPAGTASFRTAPLEGRSLEAWFGSALATAPIALAESAAGELMAFALAHPWRGDWEAYAWDVETTVYAAPLYRAMGAAEPAYRALLAALAAMGYWNAYAVLADPNPESEAFHTRLGFVLEGRHARCGYKLGRWLGISTWALRLAKGRAAPQPVRPLGEEEKQAVLANIHAL